MLVSAISVCLHKVDPKEILGLIEGETASLKATNDKDDYRTEEVSKTTDGPEEL